MRTLRSLFTPYSQLDRRTELIRKIDASAAPEPAPGPRPGPKDLPDPDKNFTTMWSLWRSTQTSEWRAIDEGERQLMLEAAPVKGSEACMCGEKPGVLFEDCCRKKGSFAMVLQTPAQPGSNDVYFSELGAHCTHFAAQ